MGLRYRDSQQLRIKAPHAGDCETPHSTSSVLQYLYIYDTVPNIIRRFPLIWVGVSYFCFQLLTSCACIHFDSF